jgi:hypothetical protein
MISSCSTIYIESNQTKVYKQLALCECIYSNYGKIDKVSPLSKDVSKSSIFIASKIPYANVIALDSFVKLNTSTFYSGSWTDTSAEDSSNNEVIRLCSEFCNSKALRGFIKSIE